MANRLWSRRWVRRLTYVLAAGAGVVGGTAFVVSRPMADRWILGRLGTWVQGETGLTFQAERLEVHPLQGRILLHHLALGGDLLQAESLEVALEWRSLLHQPHIRALRLQDPHLLLDRARLDRLQLKPHPPSKTPFKGRLDLLAIHGGRAILVEPAWGIPAGDFHFEVEGRGHATNQLQVEIRLPYLALSGLQGHATLKAEARQTDLTLDSARIQLGRSSLIASGGYAFKGQQLRSAGVAGSLDLAQLQTLVPVPAPRIAGFVTFSGQAQGTLPRLHWKGQFAGRDLQAKGLPLHPGSLQFTATGAPGQLGLDDLHWQSPDGRVTAQGRWTRAEGTHLDLQAEGVSLAPVATWARTPALQDLQARGHGRLTLPGAPWDHPRLDQLGFQGGVQLTLDGDPAGALEVGVAASRVRVTEMRLELPEGDLQGTALASLGRHGLERVQAEAEVRTDAAEVAAILRAFDIGMADDAHRLQPLDMAGQAQASATVSWSAGEGLQLSGHVDVLQPRWHAARADHLQTEVSIDRDQLRVTDIQLAKGDGRAYGDLWLTWADLAPGADAIDMCYRATQLPIHEGLKAGDQDDVQVSGTGSGWVRLHGPYEHMRIEGRGVAEQAEVYGLRIPAAAADFTLDLGPLRLQATDARIADSLEHLQAGAPGPAGPLAMTATLDMEIERGRWRAELAGEADSQVLGLPGPHLQGHVKGHLDGPITAPFGPFQLPTGQLELSAGRLTQGSQSLSGLEAAFSFDQGHLSLRAGLEGFPTRILTADALQVAPRRLSGTLDLDLGPDSADTARLANELSQGFLKDARMKFLAQGSWGPEGLNFTGSMDHLHGQFEGFQLVQGRPGQIDGDGSGVIMNLELEGHPDALPAAAAGSPVTRLTLAGGLPFSPRGPLSLQVDGSAEIANLKTILDHLAHPAQYSLLSDMRPGGTARVNLHLGGTPIDASLDGSLNLKGGRVSVSTYPQSVENLDFTAHFRGHDIVIDEADPAVGVLAQGTLKAWGKATWQRSGAASYDLHASLQDFQIRDIPEGFDLLGSLDGTLKGNDQDGGLLKGTIQAKHMDYHADINLSDILLASASGTPANLGGLDPSDPLAKIDLDLDFRLAEPWEIDTNILQVRGRPDGPFKIMGTLAQPGLKGKMDFLPGGRITNLLPTDVVLERGTLEFKDPSSFDPLVDFQGRVDVPPYLVTLGLSGTLDHLQVSTSSTPSLRQEEIIAILIDPDATTSVGSSDAYSAQGVLNTGLASGSTGLISSLALANFQENVRRTLSLDRVNVAIRSSLGTSDTAVTIGKSYNMFGYRIPVVLIHRKEADITTVSGQLELRLGNLVLQMGGSQTTGSSLAPSGEIRYNWSPK